MLRLSVSSLMLLACIGTAQAQSMQCYVRLGPNSAQYEGKCPNSDRKWETFENHLGAFGRNCQDESWTYNRSEKTYVNHRSNTTLPMADCPAQR